MTLENGLSVMPGKSLMQYPCDIRQSNEVLCGANVSYNFDMQHVVPGSSEIRQGSRIEVVLHAKAHTQEN